MGGSGDCSVQHPFLGLFTVLKIHKSFNRSYYRGAQACVVTFSTTGKELKRRKKYYTQKKVGPSRLSQLDAYAYLF